MLSCRKLWLEMREKLKTGKLTIIPVANADAFGLMARTGPDNRDMARSFPTGKLRATANSDVRITEICKCIEEADFMIDLHTGGKVLDILPLAGYLLHPDKQITEQQRKMARWFGLPIIWGTDPDAEGRSLSLARDLGIPAIYAECRGGLIPRKKTIEQYYRGCLRVMAGLNMIPEIKKGIMAKQVSIEDHRKESGHLQVKHPSPAEGIFIASTKIGVELSAGTELGRILDPCSENEWPVEARESGILFMLNIAGHVKKNDPLAGILPIHQKPA
jgi:predicted deacylase